MLCNSAVVSAGLVKRLNPIRPMKNPKIMPRKLIPKLTGYLSGPNQYPNCSTVLLVPADKGNAVIS